MDELSIEFTVAEAAALLELVNAGSDVLDMSLEAEDIITIHNIKAKINDALEGRLGS